MSSPALIVFARAPVSGRAKTRLVPALGQEGAADLYRCFLLDTLAAANTLETPVLVAAAEAAEVPALRKIVADVCPRATVFAQTGVDLGERMLHAVRHALGLGHRPAVVMGTDIPSLPWVRVESALGAERDLVLGPCLDGGYYLIGVREAHRDLFVGLEWSTPTVCRGTLARARELNLSISLLEPWYDVDQRDDLTVLSLHLAALTLAGEEIPCPRTARCLEGARREAGRSEPRSRKGEEARRRRERTAPPAAESVES